jgi:hypothetical protein
VCQPCSEGDHAAVRNGYLTHLDKDMQIWLLHAEAEGVLSFVCRGTDFDAGFQDAYTDLLGMTVSPDWAPKGCKVGLYKSNAVGPELESAWFPQTLKPEM